MKGLTVRLLCVILVFSVCGTVLGQTEKKIKTPPGDLPTIKDSTLPDTLKQKSDTLMTRQDSLAQKRKRSEIETTITYSARDSINSSIDRKIVRLYGDSKIQYGEIQLIAEAIVIDYEKSTISASGKLDSLGRRVGYPVFVNGQEKYETKSIVYNFKSKKAFISEVVTKQGEGFLHGDKVFKNDKNQLLSVSNAYTTCNLPHPHYNIMATKAKAIPGDKMVVGPFYMEVNKVPLPLGWAFGIFPSPRKSASGIIVPIYGEERNRGFFLRNGGYFFDVSEYFKMQVTGDIYAKGSSAFRINSNYNKRYHYSGTFNFNFSNNYLSGNIELQNSVKDFQVTWSHSPQSKGTGRFAASVNAATASYNNNNFLGIGTNPAVPRLDNTTRKLNSNVSYSKSFGSLYNLSVNLRINQDLTTKQIDLPLPDLSFNVNNIYPFKKSNKGLLLENISLRYSIVATNQITNNLGKIKKGGNITQDSIAPFNLQTLPLLIEKARKGIRHNIPLATSFKILRFFTISPSVTVDDIMYFEKLNWKVSADGKTAVVKDTLRQFNQVFNYSGGVNLTTRIFGTYFFKGKSGIQAIRHIINPSINLSYQPNFGDPSYGYYQPLTLVNNPNVVYKSHHEGFVYGSSRFGASEQLGFGINNNVEMKVKSKKDTVAKKIALFNTLSINSGYNFRADSFKLAPFSMAANTNVLNDKLNVNMTAALDPYNYVTIQSNENSSFKKEIRTSEYAWGKPYITPAGYHIEKVGSGIGRITSANLALSTNLSPKGQKKDNTTRDKIGKSNISDSDKKFLLQNPDSYIDFNIPWNLRVSYNADYSHPTNVSPIITQAMRFNGDLSLTEKWKLTFNSGYDFQKNELTQTYITIARDLHCWLINLSWVPFGKYTSYNFYIGVKSSLLKDLKLNRTRSFYDN